MGPQLGQILGKNLLGHEMFHPKSGLHSLSFIPASAVGLLSSEPSADASVSPVRSQGKQLSCFPSPSFVLTQLCGSCCHPSGTACAVQLPLLAEEPPVPEGSWPLALPSSSHPGALGQALQWQSSPEQLCSSTAVFRTELLLKSLPRDNNRPIPGSSESSVSGPEWGQLTLPQRGPLRADFGSPAGAWH